MSCFIGALRLPQGVVQPARWAGRTEERIPSAIRWSARGQVGRQLAASLHQRVNVNVGVIDGAAGRHERWGAAPVGSGCFVCTEALRRAGVGVPDTRPNPVPVRANELTRLKFT